MTDGDELKIRLTYELVGDTTGNDANAKEVLKKYLLTDKTKNTINGTQISNAWDISHYSEITAYYTDYICLDRNSKPRKL